MARSEDPKVAREFLQEAKTRGQAVVSADGIDSR